MPRATSRRRHFLQHTATLGILSFVASAIAAQISDTNATANSLLSGMIRTNLGKSLPAWQQWGANYFGWMFFKTVEEGSATSCYVPTNPDLVDVRGFYFADCAVAEARPYMTDDAMTAELWRISTELTRDYPPAATPS